MQDSTLVPKTLLTDQNIKNNKQWNMLSKYVHTRIFGYLDETLKQK